MTMEPTSDDPGISAYGALLGLKTGAVMAALYCVGYALIAVVASSTDEATLFFPILLAGCIIGVLPALLIGWLTGWIIGSLLEHRQVLTRFCAGVIGFLVCITLALPLNAFCWLETLAAGEFYTPSLFYFLLLGVPSVLYVLTGIGMSIRVYQTHFANRQSDKLL